MKRKDSKGRVLRNNEYVRSDGRYVYQYQDIKGNRKAVYSWRLVETDAQPRDKPKCKSLREMEKAIEKDAADGIDAASKETLNSRWDSYIDNKPELKQSTRTNYKYLYNKYVRDDIGKMPIKNITYSVVRKFFNELIHKIGFKPNSVESIQTILHPVFTVAMRDGLIRTNPTDGLISELKKTNGWEKTKRHSLTTEQQNNLLDFIRNSKTYSHWEPLIVCLLGTGCRIAEFLGLRWQDVFWKENYISINHNLIYRLQDDGTVKMHITTPKTKSGIREVPMFSKVREMLEEEHKRQAKEGFCKTEVDGYSGFIWMNRFGDVIKMHDVNRALDRIVNTYNNEETASAEKEHRQPELLPHISAHHLRHTFCTRLCENETDLKVIQEVMGHADITTTMDIYNESNLKRKKESFAKIEKHVIGL